MTALLGFKKYLCGWFLIITNVILYRFYDNNTTKHITMQLAKQSDIADTIHNKIELSL